MTAQPILYDPDCGFCRVCVAVLLRWDRYRRLRPVSLASTEADALLGDMPEGERMSSWHLVLPDGTVRSAGDAFPDLFRLLPGGVPLSRLSLRFPRVWRAGYRWVADHRTAFGKPLPERARCWADRVISESLSKSR
jgi:predicted DCC family thiol-disulfide oxidoreductase YuxK